MNSFSASRHPMVSLRDVRKAYGASMAIDNLSLDIAAGEFVTLLGPSGSGKTTCLRAIAGMIKADSGTIRIAGRDVSSLPVHRRNVGMVFQNYSLFPHLTVAQNVAYPLRVRGEAPATAQRKVDEVLAMIRLAHLGARLPNQLSGGQQQRVALARALVFNPDVLLLDEPLSALDRLLREEMQQELRRIHREIGKTMVCVTHDRTEALAMSNRLIVMRDGRIAQDGHPRAVYEHATSRFVAEFLGEINALPMMLRRADDGGAELQDENGRSLRTVGATDVAEGRVDYVVRIEDVGVRPVGAGGDPAWRGTVTDATFLGESCRLVVECAPHALTCRVSPAAAAGLEVGSAVQLDLVTPTAMVFACAV